MDLFEYILETMNYNLYTDEYLFENILTEDMITEAVDIRKLGSAIKKLLISVDYLQIKTCLLFG